MHEVHCVEIHYRHQNLTHNIKLFFERQLKLVYIIQVSFHTVLHDNIAPVELLRFIKDASFVIKFHKMPLNLVPLFIIAAIL